MKKLLIILVSFVTGSCYATGGGGHASGHASAHASGHASAHVAAHESIAAHETIAARPYMVATSTHAAQQLSGQNVAAIAVQSDMPKGVLTCDAYDRNHSSTDGFYDGCMIRTPGWSEPNLQISIQDYFEKHKPYNATKITMIIFDIEHTRFEIYYS